MIPVAAAVLVNRYPWENPNMKLASNMWVAVVDGARGLILKNEGTAMAPQLTVLRSYAIDNPMSHEQGRDRPGRFNDASGAHRSSVEIPDPHQKVEDRFVTGIIAELAEDAADGAFDKIVIVAPPVALGVMRKEIGGKLAGLIVKEIAADYVKMPVPEIAKAVQRSLEG